MLKDIDTLIFDMDGTLIDSMGMWHEIDREFFEKHGRVFPENFVKELDGLSFDDTADYFINVHKFDYTRDEIQKIWHEMSYKHYKDIIPYKPGAFEFIKKAHNLGYKMGIATSNSRDLVEVIDSRLHFTDYIKIIVTNDEVPNGKPAPDIYRKVAETLNSDPKKCLVFEDVPGGIRAGKAAGMKVCAVHDDLSMTMDEEKKNLSDYYIYNYSEIDI